MNRKTAADVKDPSKVKPATTDRTTGDGVRPTLAWAEEAGIPVEEVGMVARLLRINMFVEQLLDEIVAPHGISVADSMVLANMRRGTTSPVGLCRNLNRTTGGMSLTIDRLVAAGWVDRAPDPNDRRRVIVKLTDEGLAKAQAFNDDLHAWEDSLPIDDESIDSIGHVLDEVAMLLELREPS